MGDCLNSQNVGVTTEFTEESESVVLLQNRVNVELLSNCVVETLQSGSNSLTAPFLLTLHRCVATLTVHVKDGNEIRNI